MQVAPGVETARGALNVLMDSPHPLDILGDPASYGPTGAISRFHNPDNYTAALGGVLRAQVPYTFLIAPWGPQKGLQLGARPRDHRIPCHLGHHINLSSAILSCRVTAAAQRCEAGGTFHVAGCYVRQCCTAHIPSHRK